MSTTANETSKETIFPRSISNKIFIRRRKMSGGLPGQDPDESKRKIGSSFRGTSPLRGLSPSEEFRFLAPILGVSKDSQNWDKMTRDYWASLTREVPPGDGIELEIGFHYETKADYEHDLTKALRDPETGAIMDPKGTPLHVSDWIFYKYCLKYSRVANNPDDIHKSPKIEFYIYSKVKEVETAKIAQNKRREANQEFYKRIGERDWVDFMLRLLVANDKDTKHSIKDIPSMPSDEKDIVLEGYVSSDPTRFLSFANDKNLELKSFIELAIASGKLTRIPNTSAIMHEGTSIGNNMEEAVGFLNNPKNVGLLNALKAQVNLTP